MSQESPESKSYSMFDVLLLDVMKHKDGSQAAFSARTGISRSTIWSWFSGRNNPMHQAGKGEVLTREMGRDATELAMLARISVEETCDLVLQAGGNHDPEEQAWNDRFRAVIEERGLDIPAAAYVIYFTGGPSDRHKLTSLLESGTTPPTMPVDAMQFALDQLPDPK
jgi:transcriptional regulator with XRE-family HTH domain